MKKVVGLKCGGKGNKIQEEICCNSLDNGITYCKEFHLKSGLHKGLQKGN